MSRGRRLFRRQATLLRDAGVDSFEAVLAIVEDEGQPRELRLAACWELGYGKNRPSRDNVARAVGALLNVCGTGQRELTMQAANALVGIGSNRALLPLIRLLQQASSAATREAAAYALGFLADQRALVPLIRTLEDGSEHSLVRAQAAEALGELAQTLRETRTKRPIRPLLAALRDRSPDVRFWACYALSGFRDRRALPALRKLIRDRAVVKGWWSVGREARWAIAVLERDPRADALWQSNSRMAVRPRRKAVRKRRGRLGRSTPGLSTR
jgi:HEAT repeat protein